MNWLELLVRLEIVVTESEALKVICKQQLRAGTLNKEGKPEIWRVITSPKSKVLGPYIWLTDKMYHLTELKLYGTKHMKRVVTFYDDPVPKPIKKKSLLGKLFRKEPRHGKR